MSSLLSGSALALRPSAITAMVPSFETQGTIRNWSMTLVFDEVVPWLREQGVMDDAVFDTIFVDNPRRWLAGA